MRRLAYHIGDGERTASRIRPIAGVEIWRGDTGAIREVTEGGRVVVVAVSLNM
jgi:hypothetical protein